VFFIADIPGWYEYQDHICWLSVQILSDSREHLMRSPSGRSNPEELIKSGDKILGWNAMDITCKLRRTNADVAAWT